MKRCIFITTSLLLLAACEQQPSLPIGEESNSSTSSIAQTAQSSRSSVAETLPNISYENTAYGYRFSYPSDQTDLKTLDLDEVTPTSEGVMVRDLGGKTLMLQIKAIVDSTEPRQWLEQYAKDNDNIAVGSQWTRDVTFAGQPAIEARGEGRLGSLYRMIVLRKGNTLFMLTQNIDDFTLNKIMQSFTFTDTRS